MIKKITSTNWCGDKPSPKLKLLDNMHKSCQKYAKCNNQKCDNAEWKLATGISKIPIEKSLKIIEQCIVTKGDKRQCSLDKQKKISPAIKQLVENVETCRNITCKKESNDMQNKSTAYMNNPKMSKNIKKIIKTFETIRKNKKMRTNIQTQFKKIIKLSKTKSKKTTLKNKH